MSVPGRFWRPSPKAGRQARRVSSTVLAALAGLLLAATQATAAPGGLSAPTALEERIDDLVRDGYERPAQSAGGLAALLARSHDRDEQRQLLQGLGTVQAQSGHSDDARLAGTRLEALADGHPDSLEAASAKLVLAVLAESAGQLDAAAELAQEALGRFTTGCNGAASAATAAPAKVCEYRSAWRALQVLQRRAMSRGLRVKEASHAQAGLELAERAQDAGRQVINLGTLALMAEGRGEAPLADQLMARARRLSAGDMTLQAKQRDVEARLDAMRGDHTAALHHLEQAREMAAAAGAPRLEARMLTNLSDAYAQLARPLEALHAAEAALPVARRHHDLATERVLVNNIGIAKIGLGHIAEGKADMVRLLELWQAGGETGRQAETLREFGTALAAAGDAASAAELFHKEQALSAELMSANRTLALKDLQLRNEAEARQRDIAALSRANAAKGAALREQELLQRVFWLLAGLMLAATVAVALLYRRVRQSNARLAANHAQLKLLSERDPLTGLANRRHFHAVMGELAQDQGFEGGLLLIDIDHFKRINDDCGHATGDEVLVEVARRMGGAVRQSDLVVRWGGEEFLIFAPGADAEQVAQLAGRVLQALADQPVVVGARRLRVTASIGHGRFERASGATGPDSLAATTPRVTWEQAVHLADTALYAAKAQGRNRSVGVGAGADVTQTERYSLA